jgi:hypothetical protein
MMQHAGPPRTTHANEHFQDVRQRHNPDGVLCIGPVGRVSLAILAKVLRYRICRVSAELGERFQMPTREPNSNHHYAEMRLQSPILDKQPAMLVTHP